MNKFFIFIMAAALSVNVLSAAKTSMTTLKAGTGGERTNVEISENQSFKKFKAKPGPTFKITIAAQVGSKEMDCLGWWPFCHLKINNIPIFKSDSREMPGTLVCYNDELQLIFKEKDIMSTHNRTIINKLIGVKSVVFGDVCDFSKEIISKMNNKNVTRLEADQTYQVSRTKDEIIIHIPLD